MVHVPSTTASILTTTIKDVLIRCIRPLSNCRGQAYDGAANMMGHLRGVATVIENEHQPSEFTVSLIVSISVYRMLLGSVSQFEMH